MSRPAVYNAYAVLGVPPGADLTVIKAAHRSLARQFHPDLNPDGAERCAAVNTAWDVLSDSERRRKHDLLLGPALKPCGTCKGRGTVLKQKGFKAKVEVTCPACAGSGT